jgi:RNA polymerase sigma factor (sigma-70 family)
VSDATTGPAPPGDLVAAACRGDAGAMDALLRRAQPDARRFARRVCATAEDAEDAVQLALFQIHRRLGSLRDAAALVAWTFRIVTRACLRMLRLRGRETGWDAAAMERLVAATPEPTLRRDVLRALADLPESYRTVLVLRDVEEMTAPEAAAVLGLSVEATKSRLHRARAMLRERLLRGGYGG